MSAPTKPIAALDVPTAAVEADVRLQQLLAAPPAGHTAIPQPNDWYEAVFDLLACTHPESCTCTPEETSRG
ncbi:hypothetical protein AB5J55_35065 [Streptomyces sp. R11]|uniref:Uncharacterized protein n=1 Tax=Streptomyces sp. R11 TaxID=3238625 RepID=A0AB39NAK9_9ACTN